MKNLAAGCFLLVYGAADCAAYSNPVKGIEVVSNDTWLVAGELSVGDETPSNALHIVSGSQVQNTTGYIGFLHNAHRNEVVVDNSRWENTSKLYVGLIGSENQLKIRNLASVTAANGYVGHSSSSHSNRVDVLSGGSWEISNSLYIGSYSSGNVLHILDGSVEAGTVSIGRSSSSFENAVVVDGGRLSSIYDLILGAAGSNNTIAVEHGGLIDAGRTLMLGESESGLYNRIDVRGSNSTVQAGSLVIGGAGQYSRINAREGAGIHVDGSLILGAAQTGRNNQLRLWDTSTTLQADELLVGEEGRYNQVRLSSGASAAAGNAYVGFGSNSVGNLILIDGPESRFAVKGELQVGVNGGWNRLFVRKGAVLESEQAFIGSEDHAKYNEVLISSGSVWTNRNRLSLANRSTLTIGSGARVVTGSYQQDGTSTLAYGFDPEAGTAGVGLLAVDQDAVFDEGSLIDFRAPLSQLEIGREYTLLTAQRIIGGGYTNDVSTLLPEQLLLDVGVVESNGAASLQYVRKSLVDATGTAGTALEEMLNSIDMIAQSNVQAEVMLQAVSRGEIGKENVAEKLDQLYSRRVEVVSVVEQARVSAIGQISLHMRTVQTEKYHHLTGPSGPHKAGQGWAPWMKAYGSKGRADEQEQFSAYKAKTVGGVFGVDRSVGALLGGLAGGYSRSSVDQKDGDSSDVNTYYGSIYGSAGVRRWYTDFSLSYGRSSVKANSGAGLGTTASFNADDYTAYAAVGRQARNRRWLITPQASLTGSYYIQESYEENSVSAMPTEVESYDRWSLRGSIGGALAYEKIFEHLIVKPEIHGYWVHEFNAEQEEIGYRLIGSGGRYTYGIRSPDEDTLEVGLGLELLFADRLKMTFDLDLEHGDYYEGLSASGRLSYEF